MEEFIGDWIEEIMSRKVVQSDHNNQMTDLELYTRLQKTFIKATRLNGNVTNAKGAALTTSVKSNNQKFCALIHSNPEGNRRCCASDLQTTNEAISQDKAVICQCHAGLFDSAVPINFHNQGVGTFITGQVLLEPPTEQKVNEIMGRVADLNLDPDELKQAIYQIPIVSIEQITAITEFMTMLADYISKSLHEIELTRREVELHKLLRETEMKVIHDKLHPHFLFNVLNLIAGQALMENADTTHSHIIYLSKMLRSMIKSFRPLITLEEELDQLDSYIHLQCLRFEDRLTFKTQIQDPELLRIQIPSLTLQILVENAIKHGIEPKEGPCCIQLNIMGDSEKISIEIKDNGVGMEEETISNIINEQEGYASQLSGIIMVKKRMEYYYSDKFRLTIQSSGGNGTSITICYPR